VARDPDTIQREIERARDSLADSLDVLSERANPKKFVDAGRQGVLDTLNQPKVRYALIAVGAIIGLAVLRKLFR
jgi:hypothetical protein